MYDEVDIIYNRAHVHHQRIIISTISLFIVMFVLAYSCLLLIDFRDLSYCRLNNNFRLIIPIENKLKLYLPNNA